MNITSAMTSPAVVVVTASIIIGTAVAARAAENTTQHRENARAAACAAVQKDLRALAVSADRESDRQEFRAATQEMVNAIAHQPGADWGNGLHRWEATYGAQVTEDNYARTLAERAQRNLATCRG